MTASSRPSSSLARKLMRSPPMATNLRAVMPRHGPPGLLELIEGPIPVPAPDEVRIRVETAGLSPADLLICWGLHPEARRPPFTPGWDVIGVVDAVGRAVAAPGPGTRVAALTIVDGFSRFVCVPARHVVEVPVGLDPLAAQCLPFDYTVAYQLLTRVARVPAGGALLVQGAAGSIGGALVELGRDAGLTVYGTAAPAKCATVARLGGIPIDYTAGDPAAAIRRQAPRGVDAALDGVGYTLLGSYRALAPGGVVVAFGHASSVMGGRRDLRRLARTLWATAAVFGRCALTSRRARVYSIQALRARHPDWYRADLGELFARLAEGRIRPRFFGVRPLEAAREALEEVSAGPGGGQADPPHGRGSCIGAGRCPPSATSSSPSCPRAAGSMPCSPIPARRARRSGCSSWWAGSTPSPSRSARCAASARWCPREGLGSGRATLAMLAGQLPSAASIGATIR
jgi:NADPH2:quinone reductase